MPWFHVQLKLIERPQVPDYWQTDNSNGLVMVIRTYHWLFDLDLWPTTLNYNPRLVKVKVDPHVKIKDQR